MNELGRLGREIAEDIMEEKLEDIARKSAELVRVMQKITDSPEYKGIWTIAFVHGCQYNGENWGKEYEHLCAALKEAGYLK